MNEKFLTAFLERAGYDPEIGHHSISFSETVSPQVLTVGVSTVGKFDVLFSRGEVEFAKALLESAGRTDVEIELP